MTVINGRQTAKTLEGIREDHVARYMQALRICKEVNASTVSDLGSGCGYGSWILAHDFDVFGYEKDGDAIAYAAKHWHHPRAYRAVRDISRDLPGPADVFVAFEILEHFHCEELLKKSTELCRVFIGSVPNEDLCPFSKTGHPEHVRHYTPDELVKTLTLAGWEIKKLGSQETKKSDVNWNSPAGRTLVFEAHA